MREARLACWIIGGLLIAGHLALCSHSYCDDFWCEWPILVSKHWFLFLLVTLLLSGTGGYLARGLGLQHLFRPRAPESDPYARTWNNYAVWAGFCTTILLAEVWVMIGTYEAWNDRTPWWVSAGPYMQRDNLLPVLKYLVATGTPFLVIVLVLAAVPYGAERIRWADVMWYGFGVLLALSGVIVLFFAAYSGPTGYLVAYGLLGSFWLLDELFKLSTIVVDKSWTRIAIGLLLPPLGVMAALSVPASWTPSRTVPPVILLLVAGACGYWWFGRQVGVRWYSPRTLIAGAVGVGALALAILDVTRSPGEQLFTHVLVRSNRTDGAGDTSGGLYDAFWLMIGLMVTALFALRSYRTAIPVNALKMLLSFVGSVYSFVIVLEPGYYTSRGQE